MPLEGVNPVSPSAHRREAEDDQNDHFDAVSNDFVSIVGRDIHVGCLQGKSLC
jgi:hypothetical protein